MNYTKPPQRLPKQEEGEVLRQAAQPGYRPLAVFTAGPKGIHVFLAEMTYTAQAVLLEVLEDTMASVKADMQRQRQ